MTEPLATGRRGVPAPGLGRLLREVVPALLVLGAFLATLVHLEQLRRREAQERAPLERPDDSP